MAHNNNEQNLTPFKPGHKPVGAGRPKGTKNTATIIKKFMKAKMRVDKHPITKKPGTLTMQEMMVLAMLKKATNGDARAFDSLIDRIDGKVPQKIQPQIGEGGEGGGGVFLAWLD